MKPINHYINMRNINRVFPGLFPLTQIGILNYLGPMPSYKLFSNKLELCIRFSSEEDIAHDIINGTKYQTPFPNIFIKTPDMIHGTRIEKIRNAFYFAYDPRLYDRMKEHGLLEPPFLWHFQMTPKISLALNNIEELAKQVNEYGVADCIDTLALQLFQNLLLKRSLPSKVPHERSLENRIHRIASYLQLNFLREIDYDNLYSKNGFSRRNFFRYWNRYYNLPPAKYILSLKLEYAQNQLRETNIPVRQISEELNFKNQYYLSMLFKKSFGITPLQYRKKYHS